MRPKYPIEVSQVCCSRGGRTVVSNMDFRMTEGEIVCLVGPSGCGKSTLLKAIAGTMEPDKGEVLCDRANVSYLPQHDQLFPWLTVAENISFGWKDVAGADTRRALEWAMKLMEISGLEHRYPDQLSGGQRNRVSLARAIIFHAPVLLLDEPFSALDSKLRLRLAKKLQAEFTDVGQTTLIVTHHLDEAALLGDRILFMNSTGMLENAYQAALFSSRAELLSALSRRVLDDSLSLLQGAA